MFTKIGHILPKAMQKNDMAPKLARARVFGLFEEEALRTLGAEHAGDFKALQLVGGVMTVACKSSPVAGALRAAESQLKEAVARGGGEVERFRFLLAPWR